jgi:hypothetical protein
MKPLHAPPSPPRSVVEVIDVPMLPSMVSSASGTVMHLSADVASDVRTGAGAAADGVAGGVLSVAAEFLFQNGARGGYNGVGGGYAVPQ